MLLLHIAITCCFLLINLTTAFSMKRIPRCLNIKGMTEQEYNEGLVQEMRRRVLLARLKAAQEKAKENSDEEENTENDRD